MMFPRWLLATLTLPVLAACTRDRSTTERPATTPAPAASTTASASAAGTKGFGEPCVEDGECAAAVCFHKRLKTAQSGPERRGGDDAVEHDGYCSLRCSGDGDCPVPPSSGRCGARGMCKRP
jgi:hypothetical protein